MCFIASPQGQEGSGEVGHSHMVEMVAALLRRNATYCPRAMKCSEEAAYVGADLAMVVAAAAVEVTDIRVEWDDFQGAVEAMPVASEDFLASGKEVQGVEVDECS